MTKKLGSVYLPLHSILSVGLRSNSGQFSSLAGAIVPTKKVAPLPPTIESVTGIENAPGTIKIVLSLPTANTDGSPIALAELVRIRIHYNSEPGVTEACPYNDFPVSSHLTWAPGLSGRVYVRAKVLDSHYNWSELSNEAFADVPEVEEFDFWAHRIGVESIFTNNSPQAGYVSWSNVKVYYKNQGWAVQDGSTNKRYIYWMRSAPTVFQTSDSVPQLGIEDVLIGTNVNGIWHLAVYHPQVSAEFIRVGTLQSRNWSENQGSLFDLDTGLFKLGGSAAPKLSWDGTTLSVIGNVIVTGGTVPYQYVAGGPPANADNTATVIANGLITTGRIELGSSGTVKAGIDGAGTSDSDIRFWAGTTYANRANAPFRVTQGGALVATSATITGVANLTGGSLGGSGVVTIDAYGIDIGTGRIKGGATGYNAGTGFWLGRDGALYKFFVGTEGGNRITWDGSTLNVVGQITVTGGSVPYSYVTGGPPANADNTATVIGAGLITTGRIELGSGGYVKAGIDGSGTSDADIRIWAGATYANRANAPFRVTQGGALVATSATITGVGNLTGGYLGGSGVVTIDSSGIDIGTGRIQGGATGYNSGTGFWLGKDGTTYKFFVGTAGGNRITWDGSTLTVVGQITVTGGSVPYSYVTGGPPANADNTATVIGAGLITTGRIELGSGSTIKAGIDGSGTSDSDIRIWAGATYANRSTAPFRVTQGGALVATAATITGGYLGGSGVVTIDSSGIDVGTGRIQGGATGYNSGTGFWFGKDGTTYKFFVGTAGGNRITWDGSVLNVVGQITVTGGSIPYSYVTGGPPANADNTATVIGAGLITTGRIELGSGTTVKAGIDGSGTSDSDIRIWAGAAYANRSTAPFRVTQGGALVATSATITGGYLGSTTAITIDSAGINVGTTGSIRGGKTDYGSGTGFFLGYSGGSYKIDIGSSSQYLRWDGSTLTVSGQIIVTGGSIPYSFVTGGPPINADNTATAIGAGIITTGRIELGSSGSVKAGIDGSGTSDSDIRFWAGADYANRSTAPFRVTQGGALIATSATITGGYLGGTTAITIDGSGINVGTTGSIRGGKTGYGSGTGFFLGYSGGTYKFDIGSSTQYLRWDGSTLYVKGRITTDYGSSLHAGYITTGELIGIPVYGAGAYPYAALVSSYLSAYQSASYRTYILPTEFSQLGAQGEIVLNQYYAGIGYGPASQQTFIGGGGAGFRIVSVTSGYNLELQAYYGDIVLNLSSGQALRPKSAGSIHLGTASYYFGDVNYKNLIDRGCLGDFEDGVEVEEGGRKVKISPTKAIRKIRPSQHDTPYGRKRLDYSSFPKECFRPAPIASEDFVDSSGRQFKKGEKIGEDGVELSSLVSLLIACIKELDSRLEQLERRFG